MKGMLQLALLFAGWALGTSLTAQTPLPRAHAHNDYEHPRPLADALAQGFCSVEADVWPVGGALLVAHERKDSKPERTLEALYLAPLRERAQAHGGVIFSGGHEFTLLVDIKADAEVTYALLRPLLEKYRDVLTRFTETNRTTGAITVILSGERPTEVVKAAPERWCAIDGRLPDLKKNPSPYLVPLISDNWRPTFPWFVNRELSDPARRQLQELVREAHEQGRRIRFWGVQDEDFAWRELIDAGVDLINTDKLVELRQTFVTIRAVKPDPP